MTFQTQSSDPRLDTPEKHQAIAARLDQPGWRSRTLDEQTRNQALRQAVLEGGCYIPTAAESRRGNRQLLAEIDASRVRVKPAAVTGPVATGMAGGGDFADLLLEAKVSVQCTHLLRTRRPLYRNGQGRWDTCMHTQEIKHEPARTE